MKSSMISHLKEALEAERINPSSIKKVLKASTFYGSALIVPAELLFQQFGVGKKMVSKLGEHLSKKGIFIAYGKNPYQNS